MVEAAGVILVVGGVVACSISIASVANFVCLSLVGSAKQSDARVIVGSS